jgi:hypothetical protein
MAIILKANKVNLFVSSVLFVFWYHSPNFLDTPPILTTVELIYFLFATETLCLKLRGIKDDIKLFKNKTVVITSAAVSSGRAV